MPQVCRILEDDTGQFEQTGPLDVHAAVGVHQDVANGGILQERFEGPQAEDFLQHLAANSLFVAATERNIRHANQFIDDGLHLRSGADVLQRGEFLQVDLAQQVAMEAGLQLLE